jgi:hypothetical protein
MKSRSPRQPIAKPQPFQRFRGFQQPSGDLFRSAILVIQRTKLSEVSVARRATAMVPSTRTQTSQSTGPGPGPTDGRLLKAPKRPNTRENFLSYRIGKALGRGAAEVLLPRERGTSRQKRPPSSAHLHLLAGHRAWLDSSCHLGSRTRNFPVGRNPTTVPTQLFDGLTLEVRAEGFDTSLTLKSTWTVGEIPFACEREGESPTV